MLNETPSYGVRANVHWILTGFYLILDRVHLQLGSLSHYINVRANGYEALPPFPTSPPSGSVRNVDPLPPAEQITKVGKSRSSVTTTNILLMCL